MNVLILLAALAYTPPTDPVNLDVTDTGGAQQVYKVIPGWEKLWGADAAVEFDFLRPISNSVAVKVLVYNGEQQPTGVPAVMFWVPDAQGVFTDYAPPPAFYGALPTFLKHRSVALDPLHGTRLSLSELNVFEGQEYPLYNLTAPCPTDIFVAGTHDVGQPLGYAHFFVPIPEPSGLALAAVGALAIVLRARPRACLKSLPLVNSQIAVTHRAPRRLCHGGNPWVEITAEQANVTLDRPFPLRWWPRPANPAHGHSAACNCSPRTSKRVSRSGIPPTGPPGKRGSPSRAHG
jgi:hypothetical protein